MRTCGWRTDRVTNQSVHLYDRSINQFLSTQLITPSAVALSPSAPSRVEDGRLRLDLLSVDWLWLPAGGRHTSASWALVRQAAAATHWSVVILALATRTPAWTEVICTSDRFITRRRVTSVTLVDRSDTIRRNTQWALKNCLPRQLYLPQKNN